jgi:cytosine/adenosine deaminase-related metal-dependent hydrolase
MIVALAGRRVDAPGASEKRFSPDDAEKVKERIRDFLKTEKVTAMVSAAACGSDLLALEAAGELGIRRRVVLPYDKVTFKHSSVIDRPGDWGERYDRILAEVDERGDLIVDDYDQDEESFFASNHDILDQAEELAEETGEQLSAVVVWNGQARGDEDVTGHFLEEAKQRGLKVTEIKTV